MALRLYRTERPFRQNNFDLIRLLAALQVVLFHSIGRLTLHAGAWSVPLSFFHGVPVFFVASGFLVSASYERQRGDERRYFRNRAARIFPGLWVCLFVTLLVTYVLGFRPHRPADFAWLPAQMCGLIYTPPFLQSFGSGTYNGALWTIPLELQFYLVLPLVYRIVLRNRSDRALWWTFGCFLALSLLLARFVPVVIGPGEPLINKLVRYSFLPQFYLFLYGVVLQRYRAFELNFIAGKAIPWALLYVAFCYLSPARPVFLSLGMLLLATSAISAAYSFSHPGRILRGYDISYGVYIYHGLIINLLVTYGAVGSWRYMPLLITTTLAAAYLSWRFVERPVLQMLRNESPILLEPAV